MSYGTYYVDDYSGTDYAKITAAINAANTAGGGKVALSNRTYVISQSIVLHKKIVFCGVGISSEIVCSADVPIIRIDRGNNDSSYIEICNMTLSYTSMNNTNSFHIEADRPLYLKIRGVSFVGEGRNYAGVLTWNASSGSRTQAISSESEKSFMTHIENCLFNDASIWLNDSDSRIINNYIWGNKSEGNNLAYAIRLSNGAVNVSGNDIVPGNDSGVYIASTCQDIRVENNYFDGSWKDVCTGWGVCVMGASRILILGNVFKDIYAGGVYIASSQQVTVSKNIFEELNRSGSTTTRYDVRILSGANTTTGHLIEGNQHVRSLPGIQNFAVHADNNTRATVINNALVDCRSDGSRAYVETPFTMLTNKYSIRKDNRVTSIVQQENNNQVVVSYPYHFDEGEIAVSHNSGTQSIYVQFADDFSAQGIIPRVQDININFVGSASNSAVVYSIWGLSYAGFYVAIRPVDSDSSSAGILYWRVTLQ